MIEQKYKDLFDSLGIDYQKAIRDYFGEEDGYFDMVCEYAKMPDLFQEMCEGMEQRNVDQAFHASHTLKSVLGYFGFTEAQKAVSDLCEIFRRKSFDGAEAIVLAIKPKYECFWQAIEEMSQ